MRMSIALTDLLITAKCLYLLEVLVLGQEKVLQTIYLISSSVSLGFAYSQYVYLWTFRKLKGEKNDFFKKQKVTCWLCF